MSTSGGNPGAGNLLDDVSFGTGPCLVSTKTVSNLTRTSSTAEVGDTLRYTVTTRNDGGNAAVQAVSTDVLPAGLDFVPGSIHILTGAGSGALTDASGDDRGEYNAGTRTLRVRLGQGSSATAGGSVGAAATTSYSFDARVGGDPPDTIVNDARVAFRESGSGIDRVSITQETQTPVNAAADLAITKTLETAPLVAGRPATFTIGVTNNGPQTGTGVTVTDAVPPGLSALTATPSGGTCAVAATISCALPDLAVGASASITVTGTVAPGFESGAALVNRASVSGARTDPDRSNNTATASATVTAVADVSIAKSFSPAVPVAGQDLTYTLTARNDGPSEARDVTVTDPLDPSASFVSATTPRGSCAFASGILDCAVGTLAPGESVDTTVVVRVAPGATAAVQNAVAIASSTSDADPSDNVDAVSFEPQIVADLAVEKTVSATRVAAGEQVDFTLAVRNRGPADAQGVVLDDTLPDGLSVAGIDAPAGAECSSTGGSIRCTWASFPLGGADVVVRAVVAADAPAGVATNTASVISPAEDPNTADNADSVDVEVVQTADLSVQKTAAADPVPGRGFSYAIDVRNDGPSTARGVTVSDVLPAGFVYSGTDARCALDVGTVSCDIGDLAPDGSTTITVSGTWAAGATGRAVNTASVESATPDPDASDDVSTVDQPLVPSADVVVVKTSSTPSVVRGGEAAFLVTVRNDGPSVAAGVVVAESVPPGLVLTSAVPSAGTWSEPDARWTVGTLMPGASATLSVTADVVAEGALTNTAAATAQTADPTPGNNSGSATVIASASADLAITKTASVDPAPSGGPLTYTIVVVNDGPSTASAVRVTDPLPSALLTPTTPTSGCTITARTLECAVGALAAGGRFTATVTGTVDPATADAELSNTATVSSTTADPDPSDDSATVVVPIAGAPRVELVKTASPPVDVDGDGRIGVGDTVAYSFTIRNTGTVTLTGAVLTDPLLGGEVDCSAFAGPLAPGTEVACAPVAYPLTQSDVDRGTLRNEASVAVQSARGGASDEATVEVTVPAVDAVALAKSPGAAVDRNGNGAIDAGDTIDYTFTVANTGTTTLTGARVSDPLLGGAFACAELSGIALAPGDTVTCAPVAYTLTQGDVDGGVVVNTASVTADAPSGTVTDAAAASSGIDRTATIELLKSAGAVEDADGDGVIGVGDTVAYSFSVRNAGTTTLTGATISDPLLQGDALCTAASLAPGEERGCGPFTYALTQDDVENQRVRNTARVDADGPLGALSDDATVDVVVRGASALQLTKTPGDLVDADADGRIGAGDTVPFSFTVRNTGTTVLREISIDDPLLGGGLDCPVLRGLDLAPGAEAECGPVSYSLTQADIEAGTVRNTATAVARSVLGTASASASAEVPVVGESAVALTKTAGAVIDAAADGRVGAGDTVAYRFTVRNTGTTSLRDIVIDDPLLGGILDCPEIDRAVMAPRAEVACGPVTRTLTQADVEAGLVRNSATVVADSVRGAVGDAAVADVAIEGTAGIALTKAPGAVVDTVADGRTGARDTVAYTFTVRNTGTVELRDIAVDDPLLGGALNCPALDGLVLAPGAAVDCGPLVYTLTQADADAGSVRNTAAVTAGSSRGPTADDAEADVLIPGTNAVSLEKTSDAVSDADGDGAIGAGDTVSYVFAVTNTGTTTLTDAQITDPMLGGIVECAALTGVELAPGDTVECPPVVRALTQDDVDRGQVRNEASVRASAPRGETVADTATLDVRIDGAAGIELRKSAGPVVDVDGDAAVGAGDTIAYEFRVRNLGTTTLQDITIDDPLLGGAIDCPALVDISLAPGASAACGPVVFALRQGDVEDRMVRNTATAAAGSPLGPVTDAATADVTIDGTGGIALTKTPDAVVDANDDGMIGAGDRIDYSFTVRNTGTTIISDIVIDDPLLGGVVECASFEGLELSPQVEATCGPVPYVLVQQDIAAGVVRNAATATGQSAAGAAQAAAEADVVVTGTDRLDLLKSAAAIVDTDGTGRTDAGDTVEYTFTVTNTGTTELTDITVDDPRLTGTIVCDATVLAPGRATVCSGKPAVLTQAEIDAGEIVNTASAAAVGRTGASLSSQSTVRTPIENQPAIALTKTGGEYVDVDGDGRIGPGDTVAFRFTVSNTGARTLTGIAIDDPLLGGAVPCAIPDLAPGETAPCGPARYTLSAVDAAAGEVVNVATVRGIADSAQVTAAATASVDVRALAATGGVVTAAVWAVVLLALGALALFTGRSRRRARVYRDSA